MCTCAHSVARCGIFTQRWWESLDDDSYTQSLLLFYYTYTFFLPPSVDGWMCEQCSERSERDFVVVLTLPPRKTKSINIGFVLYSQLRSRFLFRFSSRLLWAHCRLSHTRAHKVCNVDGGILWTRNEDNGSNGNTNRCNKRFICISPSSTRPPHFEHTFAWNTYQSAHKHNASLLNSMYFYSEFLFRWEKITHSISSRVQRERERGGNGGDTMGW